MINYATTIAVQSKYVAELLYKGIVNVSVCVQSSYNSTSMKTPECFEMLVRDGLVDEVVSRLMSGKEADVYVVQ